MLQHFTFIRSHNGVYNFAHNSAHQGRHAESLLREAALAVSQRIQICLRLSLAVIGLVLATHTMAEGTRGVLIDKRTPTGTSEAFQEPVQGQEQSKAQAAQMDADSQVDAQSGQVPRLKPEPPIIVRVTGYGAYDATSAKKNKSSNKRLLAIRASRLDAYRNLAERVYGLSVSGQSKVKDFALAQDEFGASVDTVVRGARVVSISENPETGIETVLELELPADFRQCLNRVNNFRYRADCLRPLTHADLSSQAALAQRAQKGEPDNRMRTLYYLK